MVVISIFVIAMLFVFWWIVRSYLGNMFATFIILVVVCLLLLWVNKVNNEPTQRQLDTYESGRKGVGYL